MFARASICLILLFFAGAAFAEDTKSRIALVIGNSAYSRAALANPVNDARLMGKRLEAQGFEVIASYDAGQGEMKRAVQSFSAGLRKRGKDAVAFIFYAGHGAQVKGENYLIPVDEQIKGEADVDIDAVSLSSIMSMLENTQTRLAIVVLDACRDNPFAFARGGQRGLARVDAPGGSLVAFSTSPGKVAPDGPAGGNSYYTAALAEALAEPGLEIEKVFKKVRVAVREKTRGEQTPWETTSLTGDFFPAGEKVGPREHAQQSAAMMAAMEAPKSTAATMQYEDKAERLVRTFTGHSGYVRSVAFSPDGRTLASASDDKTLKLWDAASGRELRTLAGHESYVFSVAFSPDGRTLASASGDKTLKLWAASSGALLRSFAGHKGYVHSVAFSPDGRTLASASDDGTLKLWDAASGQELRTFTGDTGAVSVAFSPEGRTLASASRDKSLKLWDAASGQELRILAGHTDYVFSVAFSPNGRMLVSGGKDNAIKLWDAASGALLRTLTGPTSYVTSVVFSPDGRHLLSGHCAGLHSFGGCQHGSIKLWLVSNGEELQEFTGLQGEVAVAFSPDGRFALSGSGDKTLKLWDVSEWTQPQEARR